jgi:hypothetical protein
MNCQELTLQHPLVALRQLLEMGISSTRCLSVNPLVHQMDRHQLPRNTRLIFLIPYLDVILLLLLVGRHQLRATARTMIFSIHYPGEIPQLLPEVLHHPHAAEIFSMSSLGAIHQLHLGGHLLLQEIVTMMGTTVAYLEVHHPPLLLVLHQPREDARVNTTLGPQKRRLC